MDSIVTDQDKNLKLSAMAEELVGSEIIRIAADIGEKISKGEKIYNLTIGDFSPAVFPIPEEWNSHIQRSYKEGNTNYPPANGMLELRRTISAFVSARGGLSYKPEEILISGGARPLIYSSYQITADPGDNIVFPVPSWNNNHYSFLGKANPIAVQTKVENNFMPTADELRPHLHNASLLSLCSPLNPTGTVFTKKGLEEICDLVIEENQKRDDNQKPLYILYDQIYWILTYGATEHFTPVSLRPELRDYTILIDGMSKGFAGTGVRVGWACGPAKMIEKMRAILTHIGAWSPKAEQVATARYLSDTSAVDKYLFNFKYEIERRLAAFYEGFIRLKNEGFPVDAIAPQAAIYLTVKLDLRGLSTENGAILETIQDATRYLLDEAKVGLVPFSAFGTDSQSSWYRLSVGTSVYEEIDSIFSSLKAALKKLS